MSKLLLIALIGFLFLNCKQNINGEKLPFNGEGKIEHKAKLVFTDSEEEKRIEQLNYLRKNIFKGLKNLNDGFDSESIYYFSESDFKIVLDRVEQNGIGIYGIEPWLNGEYYDVKVHEQINAKPDDPDWYKSAFLEFKTKRKNLMYSATYQVPEKLLTE